MEVHFSPEIERRLHNMAAQRSQPADQLVRDAVAGFFELHTSEELEQAYRSMAADRHREEEAVEWAENLTGDAAHDAR